MNPRALFVGLLAAAVGGLVFITTVELRVGELERRVDVLDRALAAIADLILLPDVPPAP
jgi:hypothetical protein